MTPDITTCFLTRGKTNTATTGKRVNIERTSTPIVVSWYAVFYLLGIAVLENLCQLKVHLEVPEIEEKPEQLEQPIDAPDVLTD